VKLSSKGRYAVRALFDIAFFNDGRPTQVKDIAERQGIPPRFLEQIFQDLKRAGLVGSKRGPQGGYSLLRSPDEVSLGDVWRVTEGAVSFSDEAEEALPGNRNDPCRQVMDNAFEDLARSVQACLDGVNLTSLCQRAERLGLNKPGSRRQVYVI
jgi:Rrf2 family protein